MTLPAKPTLLLPLLALLAFAGCETVEGFGRDLENTGDTITEEAQEAS